MAETRLNKLIAFLLLIIVLMASYLGVVAIVFYRKKTIPFVYCGEYSIRKAIDRLEQEYDNNFIDRGKEWYHNFVEKDMGLKAYIYSERDLDNYNGLTYPTIRLIVIDEDLVGYQYCTTFVHEAIHLKEFIHQENYVAWKTFLYMYENEQLQNVGVWYAQRQIFGYYQGKYNVSDLIVDYLTKN